MISPKKSNSKDFCRYMLRKPVNEKTKLLFELLSNYRDGVTPNDAKINCNISDAAKVVLDLKKEGAKIGATIHDRKNKKGRKVLGIKLYYLFSFKNGVDVYNKLLTKNENPKK